MMNDIIFALRQLRKSPGFTMVAVITLALGIGANTSIITLINALLLKPIQAHRPEQLAGLYQRERDSSDHKLFSFADFSDLRADKSVFSELAAYNLAAIGVREGDLLRPVRAAIVSANYFSTLGVPPYLGRGFLAEEESGAIANAVLDYAFWRRLGGDPDIIGSTLRTATGDFKIVGVMPEGFTGTNLAAPAFYLPVGMIRTLWVRPGNPPSEALTHRSHRMFMVFGRFNPGLDIQTARPGLQLMSERHRVADPNEEPMGRELFSAPLPRFSFGGRPSRLAGQVAPVASLALCLSMAVLCVACLNLANMLLARGAARRNEIAVRLALGASRRRILRQLLTEGALLATAGGVGGLFLALWATEALVAAVNSGLNFGAFNFNPSMDPSPDFRILLSLLGLCVLATLAFALAPARKFASLDVNEDLKQQGVRSTAADRWGPFQLRNLFVAGQLALSLPLLVAAGLFARSAIQAAQVDPGFSLDSQFVMRIDAGLVNYTEDRARELFRRVEERLTQLPDVESVSFTRSVPLGEDRRRRAVRIGGTPRRNADAAPRRDGKTAIATFNVIGNNYFKTLGIPLLAGRTFEPEEIESNAGSGVVILSRSLAEKLLPGKNPIGRTLRFPREGDHSAPEEFQVVGVVPSVTWDLFDADSADAVYAPFGQHFETSPRILVRVVPGADTLTLMARASQTLREIDSNIPLTELKTLAAVHGDGESIRLAATGAVLFGCFGAIAFFLCFVGVYGLKAYLVAGRAREIGIRVVLGASRRDVIAMILADGARMASVGLCAGLILAMPVGQLAKRYLHEVSPVDPVTFLTIPISLAAAAMLASGLPAFRASRVNPVAALRNE